MPILPYQFPFLYGLKIGKESKEHYLPIAPYLFNFQKGLFDRIAIIWKIETPT